MRNSSAVSETILATLLACAAWSSVRASGAAAQTPPPAFRAAARVESYTDSDATQVVRPRVSLEGALPNEWRASGAYTADVVTSASIDVVTRASQVVNESRHEGTASVSHGTASTGIATLGFTLGREPDYRSHAGVVSYARNLDEARLWYLVVQASASHGRVGSVADQAFVRHLYTTNATATLTRVLSRTRVLRVGLELSNLHGFQSSAYRTVRMGDWSAYRYAGDDPDAGPWVFVGVTQSARERVPDERFRGRITFDLVQSLGAHASISLRAAAYADSFQILAGEIAPELRVEPSPGWLLRLGGRVYAQSSAWFYRARYQDTSETDGYVTDDKELGRMRTYALHAAAQIPIGPVRIDARVEGDFYRYPDFTLLPHKEALVLVLGLTYRR